MYDELDTNGRLQKYSDMANTIGDELSKRNKGKKTVSPSVKKQAHQLTNLDLESLIADNVGYLGSPSTEYHEALTALQYAEDKYGVIIEDILLYSDKKRWVIITPTRSRTIHGICRAICIEIVNTIIEKEELEL